MKYYLSPTGSGTTGSQSAPALDLVAIWNKLLPGDEVEMKGGTYKWTRSQYLNGRNGQAGKLILVTSAPGEKVILTNGSTWNGNDLFEWTGNYIHWKNLEIANFTGNKSFSAFRSENCNNCIFENIYYHHNPMGFTLRNCNNNLVLNCDFAFNEDAAGDNADGINITYVDNGSYTNTIRGCRAWNNSDDGFDLWYNKGYVLIENCWAWKNGYRRNGSAAGDGSGFKVGEYGGSTTALKRTVKNCISANNKLWGYNENNCLTGIELLNTTAYNNGSKGYWFGDWGKNTVAARNNINFGGGVTLPATGQTNNSWQGKTVSSADFASVDALQLERPRKADGSLPDITFLQVVLGSDLAGLGASYAVGTTPPPPPPPPDPTVTQLFTIWVYNTNGVYRISKGKSPDPAKTLWFSIKVYSDGSIEPQ